MPYFWKVTLQGKGVIARGLSTKQEAFSIAERWQGSHSGNRGLLRVKDRGDWVEVSRDIEAEKDWDRRYEEMKSNNPQVVTYITNSDIDDLVKPGDNLITGV